MCCSERQRKVTIIAILILLPAFKTGSDEELITAFCTWMPPRTTSKLSAGTLTLPDGNYIIADVGLAIKNLIGLPALRLLGVGIGTLL